LYQLVIYNDLIINQLKKTFTGSFQSMAHNLVVIDVLMLRV